MKTQWLKGARTDAEKEVRKKEVISYQRAFEELASLLESEFKKKPCVRDYETPNWELRQIAVNEYNAVLEDILSLIKLKE